MTQDELKQAVGRAAADYVLSNAPEASVLGVGTGSTANCFIDAIAPHRSYFRGAVSSSEASTRRLLEHGFTILDPNEVDSLPIYVDGADEIDPFGNMIKGGGGALTREKIVASMAEQFVCIADESKRVPVLGNFALPIEVLALAREGIARHLRHMGGEPSLRHRTDASIFLTDNGHQILDVQGLKIADPRAFEMRLNQWPGVLTVGVFALQCADIGMFATPHGVETVLFANKNRLA